MLTTDPSGMRSSDSSASCLPRPKLLQEMLGEMLLQGKVVRPQFRQDVSLDLSVWGLGIWQRVGSVKAIPAKRMRCSRQTLARALDPAVKSIPENPITLNSGI